MSNRYLDKNSDVAFYHTLIKLPDNGFGDHSFAFKGIHKRHLEKLLFKLEACYSLDVVCYSIMGSYAHFVVAQYNASEEDITLSDAALRYQQYYDKKEKPDARSIEVRKFRKRLNDLSMFMRDIQRRFTFWYNKQFQPKRRGSLWNPRYKSTILKSATALAECMKYVEFAPLRAELEKDPANYPFSSWGHISRSDFIGTVMEMKVNQALQYMHINDPVVLSEEEIYYEYSGDLQLAAMAARDGLKIKELDPEFSDHLLEKSEFWSESRYIEGDDELIGVGYGSIRPRQKKIAVERD